MALTIEQIDLFHLHIPFYAEHVKTAMHRAQTHDEGVTLYRVGLSDGTVGYGDGAGRAQIETDLVGRNPWEVWLDDSIGFGPQVALVDALGKATGSPAHALLGRQIRHRCPLSWWNIDMPPADWVKEAECSLTGGYTTFKMKARPWRDILEQVAAVGQVVPDDYRFDIDFNGFLLTAARAEEMLSQLDNVLHAGMYESPYYLYKDLTGARMLRERVRKPIVEHFRDEVLHEHASDGFVIGGTIHSMRHQASLAEAFNKPFWLQLVGAGPTTAFALHLGSVLSHAQLPYITCHELFESDLLTQRLQIIDGYGTVPDGPGLGVDVDPVAIETYRVEPGTPTPKQLYRQQKRLLHVRWPGPAGQRSWSFTDEAHYQAAFYAGSIPGFQTGVYLDVEEDDGSASFAQAHAKLAQQGL